MSIPRLEFNPQQFFYYIQEQRLARTVKELARERPFNIDTAALQEPSLRSIDYVEQHIAELVLIAKYSRNSELQNLAGQCLVLFFGINCRAFNLFLKITENMTARQLLRKYDWLLFPERGDNRQKAVDLLYGEFNVFPYN